MSSLFAVCAPGLEPVLGAELRALGLPVKEIQGGVEVAQADQLERVNLWSRVASRVLLRLGEVKATAFPDLVAKARLLPWHQIVGRGAQVAFRVTCRKSRLYHSGAVAERLFLALEQAVPGVRRVEAADEPAEASPVQLFVARFDHDVCTVSADSSGALLHQRGYRTSVGKAPLRETLAAALLLAARYDGRVPLVDPLCGSGTIPIEAALIAMNRAPGLGRAFAFEKWPIHKARGLAALREQAFAGERPLKVRIEGSDSDPEQLAAARANAARAKVAVEFVERDLRELPRTDALIATNPPYGVRVGRGDDLRAVWRALRTPGRRVVAISPDDHPAGLVWKKLLTTQNGGLKVHFVEGT